MAPAHDEDVLARKIRRVVQAVDDFVQLLARYAETAEVAAAADGNDHPARPDRGRRALAGEMHRHAAAAGFDPVCPRGRDLDARVAALAFQFV